MGSPEHIARRLRRLEWATRYRPVHIQTLLLGGVAPREDAEFLYSPGWELRGEGQNLLRAVGIEAGRPLFEAPLEARDKQGKQRAVPTEEGETREKPHPLQNPQRVGHPDSYTAAPAGKNVEEIHAEFQAAGFFLAHILDCPLEDGSSRVGDSAEILRKHLPAVASRIRRSLKPRRVILVTEMPPDVVQDILALDLGCEVKLDDGKPFALMEPVREAEITRFRAVLDSRAMR